MSDIAPVLSKEFFDIQVTIECRFDLKRVYDMIRTHSRGIYIFAEIKQAMPLRILI